MRYYAFHIPCIHVVFHTCHMRFTCVGCAFETQNYHVPKGKQARMKQRAYAVCLLVFVMEDGSILLCADSKW